jgi:hypothetical protein
MRKITAGSRSSAALPERPAAAGSWALAGF